MKLVREHIEQFTRGENPFKTLKIGKRVEIENWFKTWAPHIDYEINDNLNIHIKGSLELGHNAISLPDNFHIEGYLDLKGTNIISLPKNLYIEGWLDLTGIKITSLPNDLYIEGNLFIEKTNITSLPDNLYVGGNIYK